MRKEDGTEERYRDRVFMDRLVNTMKASDADTAAYDAISMTGGRGVCFDLSRSEALAKLTMALYEATRIVSAGCQKRGARNGKAWLASIRTSWRTAS